MAPIKKWLGIPSFGSSNRADRPVGGGSSLGHLGTVLSPFDAHLHASRVAQTGCQKTSRMGLWENKVFEVENILIYAILDFVVLF